MLTGLIAGTLGIVGLTLVGLEIQYRRRLGNKLELTAGNWQIDVYEPQRYRLVGQLELINQTQTLDVMVPEIWAEVTLLSDGSLEGITTSTEIIPRYVNAKPRPDHYWESLIVEPQKTAAIELPLEIHGPDLSRLNAAWVKIHYFTYGREGRLPQVKNIVVPLYFPSVEDSQRWRPVPNADLLPIKTHLLTQLDDPVKVVKQYVLPHAQPGDIVTLGESPVAIMQGRFRNPADITPGWLATRLCYMFHSTASLATAGGLQTLIDMVGAPRVFLAFLLSVPFKLLPQSLAKNLQVDGMFYRLAGEQARLIDDVTGTIPPYDKFIVLGPDNPQALCDRIARETGLGAAVVDVNDLRRVKILATSADVSVSFLEKALITNPAGNANQQTPVVLIRPAEVPNGTVTGAATGKAAAPLAAGEPVREVNSL
jgi:hypothetical protein